MDLLEENKKRNTKTPIQKLVLTLLVASIVLCILIGIIMVYLSTQGEDKPYTISLNGKNIDLNMLKVITTENGQKYISLKELSSNLGYDYYNGEFKMTGEIKTKGYINNKTNIIQFFIDSQKIYKTTENSNTDYEYYNLENPILSSNENLYISLDDLDVAFNLIVSYSEINNRTTIETPEYWIKRISESFKDNNITISDSPENLKSLSYGYVVTSRNGKYGVINLQGEELIGHKYNSIIFCEYNKNFIASNSSNEFGVIAASGVADISLQYDSIEILNYEPLLYKVKYLNKYGVLKEDGTILNNIQYDSIGYPENKNQKTDYTLIIPNLNENIPKSIVVRKDNKYGLIDLQNGTEIISCDLNGIYSISREEEVYYIVETQDKKIFLENYIDNSNRVTVTID